MGINTEQTIIWPGGWYKITDKKEGVYACLKPSVLSEAAGGILKTHYRRYGLLFGDEEANSGAFVAQNSRDYTAS